MKHYPRLLLRIGIGFAFPVPGMAIDWPIFPDSAFHEVGSTYGQYFAGDFPYYHPGIDIMAPAGTPVYAVKSGYVKAVMTTVPDDMYYWRVIIGDSAGPQECDAWMYANVEVSSIAVSEGEWVEAGQYLADLIDYPPGTFPEHLHFVQIRNSGESWHDAENWEFITNPLDVLDNIADSTGPVFEIVYGNRLIGFCPNYFASYFSSSDTLSGDIDIVCHVYDKVNHPVWKTVSYRIEYKVEGDTVIGWRNGVCFTGPLDFPGNVGIVYQDDATCNTEGNWVDMEYYICVTDSDGDCVIESGDNAGCWNTSAFHNGPVTVSIRAFDRTGNGDSISMPMTVANFHDLAGVVQLSDDPGNLGGSIITIVPSGQVDTTDSGGLFSMPHIGGGNQHVIISRHAYQTLDTVVVMTQDRSIAVTLNRSYLCGDAGGDPAVNVGDAVFLINYIFRGGPIPCAPCW